MSFRPKHLGHVNIYVRNAERSKQWYEDVLGLHCYHYRAGWAAFLSADKDKSHEVALMQVGDDAHGPMKRQVGLNHMAWMLESLDDLKEAYHRLKARNIPIEWPRQDSVFASDMVGRGRFPGPWDGEVKSRVNPVPAPAPAE